MVAALNNVDMVSPINRLSPFARGLKAFLANPPGMASGSRLIDLCSAGPQGKHATLLNGLTWSGIAPSGFPSLRLDGTDDYASIASTMLSNLSQCTVAHWVRPVSLVVQCGIHAVNNATTRIGFSLAEDGNTYILPASTAGYGLVATPGAVWFHVCYVFDGTQTGNANRAKIYINGTQRTLTFTGTIPAATGNITGAIEIGRQAAAGVYHAGWIGEIPIYDRAFSAEEARFFYRESLANYPTLFNRTDDAEQSAVMLATAALRRKLGLHTGGGYGLGVLSGGRL